MQTEEEKNNERMGFNFLMRIGKHYGGWLWGGVRLWDGCGGEGNNGGGL